MREQTGYEGRIYSLLLCGVFALMAGSCRTGNGGGSPNVVVITIDTLRADRLGCYGYGPIDTRNIDGVAERGVRFSQVLSQVPITLPSHSTIFTGLLPTQHNVRENGTFRLDPSRVTLAETLKKHGYRTGAFVGTFTLDSRFGLDQGFDVYDDDMAADNLGKQKLETKWQGHERPYVDRPAGAVVKRALAWLETVRDGPFFLWLHVFDPHLPYEPPEPFRSRYAGRLYDGEVAYVDSALNQLLNRLDTWGLTDNTLLLITADHGESLSEHHYWGHGKKLYEASLRVPLIVSFPGRLPQGRVVDDLVRSVDVSPTILDLLGIPPLADAQGVSLMPLMNGTMGEPPNLASYGETFFPRLRFGDDALRSYRTRRWKYIRSFNQDGIVKEELFDLERDAGEIRDLAASEVSTRDELSALLDVIIADEVPVGPGASNALELDRETEDKLRSLGYLE